MSLVLHPRCSPQNVLALTSAAAVAVATAIEALTPLHPGIKWVNDVYLGNKKVCGILTEGVTNPESGLLNSVVIGIGINCTHAAFPDEVASIATSLEDEGGIVDPNRLAAEVIHRLLAFYDELPHKTWLPLYRERSLLSGKGILWQKGTDRGEGTVLGIGDDGELLLSTASGTLSLTSGEVSVIGWR
jgi:BirA family biotin operon repressor/biotin-[acetyl-CoA-carboxylase] ligase